MRSKSNKLKVRVERKIDINRTPQAIYSFWRDFENLPKFMNHLEEVEIIDDTTSHWKASGPGGKTYEWDAEIISDRPNEFISWHSLENAEVENAGSVEFREKPGGTTQVLVTLAYNPPAGAAGHQIAEWMGKAPEQEVEKDLKALKSNLEK